MIALSDLAGTGDDIAAEWSGLVCLVEIHSKRQVGNKTSEETRYYLSSVRKGAKTHLKIIRKHWGIENSLHYVLDVAFDEDDCRIRKDPAPVNMATLRHMALNLLRKEATCKNGIAVKRSKAGWDNAYLRKGLDSCSQI